MKNIFAPVLVTICLIFLASCDKVYTYEYRVKNISDTSTMIVHYHFRNDSVDNIVALPAGEEKLIYITHHGVEGKGPHFSPVANDVDSVIVIKGSARSTKDLRVDDNWIYSVSHSTGLYNATISDSEF